MIQFPVEAAESLSLQPLLPMAKYTACTRDPSAQRRLRLMLLSHSVDGSTINGTTVGTPDFKATGHPGGGMKVAPRYVQHSTR